MPVGRRSSRHNCGQREIQTKRSAECGGDGLLALAERVTWCFHFDEAQLPLFPHGEVWPTTTVFVRIAGEGRRDAMK